jgi:hypothetical protein
MRKRNLAIPTAAIAALSFAAVGPAVAQTPAPQTEISGTAKVSPSKAGTKKNPKTVGLNVNMKWQTSGPDGENKPIVQKVVIDFPKGSLYNGGKVAKCTASQLARKTPQQACKNAIMGQGTGSAWADTAEAGPKFTLVNGGAKQIFLYTTLQNPAAIAAPVPGSVVKYKGGYRLTLKVPQSLQVVAATPISLRSVNIKTNAAAKKAGWLQTTSCPKNKKWAFDVQSFQNDTPVAKFSSSVKCS